MLISSKYRLLALLLVVIAIGITWFMLRFESSGRIRNVLLISIDTCRADRLSCYGYRRKTTPNIDAIAEEGILFENVISPVPITLPAHSSMLTGTIPPYHGVHDNPDYQLAESNIALPEMLKTHAFATGAIISAFVLDSQFGLDQGFDYYHDRFDEELNSIGINERRGEEVSRYAQEWLERYCDEPFFLFLHYYDPHMLYEPPEPFRTEYSDNLYAGEIAYTDHCIGQVIKKLKELDLYDSTLLVITSDHGEALGEHNEWTHDYFVYQSTLKVPLIFKVPGRRKAVRITDSIGLVDIVPTICGLLKVPVPACVQGRDLSRYFSKKSYSAPERYFYCESFIPTKYDCNHLLGVVGDRWKYIQTTRPELYDLIKDPAESNNLVTKEAGRARILQGRLQQILERTVRKAEADSKVELDDEARSRLESLGYVASSSVSEDFEFDQTKDDPKDVIDFHNLTLMAELLIRQKKYAEANILCEKLLMQRPNSPRIYFDMGMIAFDMGKIAKEQNDFAEAASYLNKAINHYRHALRVRPNFADAHSNLGKALQLQGRLEEAINHYRQALQINENHLNANNNLAVALLLQGNLDEAISHFHRVLKVKPNDIHAHNNIGVALSRQGNLDEAISHYRHALRVRPNYADAHCNLGKALQLQGKLDEAIGHYRQAALNATKHEDANVRAAALSALARIGNENELNSKNPNLGKETMKD